MNHLTCKPKHTSIFDDFFNDWEPNKKPLSESIVPFSQIVDKGKSFQVTVELPGVKKEDIEVKIKDSVLTLMASKKDSFKEESDKVYVNEVSYGEYKRSFKLSNDIDGEEITAQFENGVIRLSIPKKESTFPKTINVK